MTSANVSSPSRYKTLYDETSWAVRYREPAIASMATRPNLLGKFEHHVPTSDGSFSICVAGGEGVFISKALLESIPAAHRPVIDTANAGQVIATFFENMHSIGTALVPIIFKNAETGENFRVVLHAIVVPRLYIHMFIGASGGHLIRSTSYQPEGVEHCFNFSNSENKQNDIKVKGF